MRALVVVGVAVVVYWALYNAVLGAMARGPLAATLGVLR